MTGRFIPAMERPVRSYGGDVVRVLVAGLTGALLVSPTASAAVVDQAPVPAARPTASPDYVFPAGSALLLFYVHSARTTDFEAVAARISQALDASADPVRRQQAASWRMFRASDSARDAVVYVFLLDPVVAGADYDPVRVLSESLPAEVQPLYEQLKASVIRIERLALTKLR
jgi:hypothetical protein